MFFHVFHLAQTAPQWHQPGRPSPTIAALRGPGFATESRLLGSDKPGGSGQLAACPRTCLCERTGLKKRVRSAQRHAFSPAHVTITDAGFPPLAAYAARLATSRVTTGVFGLCAMI